MLTRTIHSRNVAQADGNAERGETQGVASDIIEHLAALVRRHGPCPVAVSVRESTRKQLGHLPVQTKDVKLQLADFAMPIREKFEIIGHANIDDIPKGARGERQKHGWKDLRKALTFAAANDLWLVARSRDRLIRGSAFYEYFDTDRRLAWTCEGPTAAELLRFRDMIREYRYSDGSPVVVATLMHPDLPIREVNSAVTRFAKWARDTSPGHAKRRRRYLAPVALELVWKGWSLRAAADAIDEPEATVREWLERPEYKCADFWIDW